MVVTRTPYRISLFGGGTDYPVWWREHGGAVLGGSINHFCWISARVLPPFFDHRHRLAYSHVENFSELPEVKHPVVREALRLLGIHDRRGLSISHDGDLPARSGMGSSSSFTVGLLNALHALEGRRLPNDELAHLAVRIEQEILAENVGNQDQLFAAWGGFNVIRFLPTGRAVVEPLILPPGRLDALESHLLLFFTGLSRQASDVASEQIKNTPAKTAELHRIGEMVWEARRILTESAWRPADLGALLDEGWHLKRGLSSRISTDFIDQAVSAAKRAGAWGAKILGAGGGGFLLVMAPPEDHPAVLSALKNLLHVPFRFEFAGSEVVVYQPGEIARHLSLFDASRRESPSP